MSKYTEVPMRTGKRKGAIVVLVAVLMVMLLGFGAFAVDISQMQAHKSELRRAADAAVLAATLQLLHETNFWQARGVADQYLVENPVFGSRATLDEMEFGVYDRNRFTPLGCNPNCSGASIAPANSIRLVVRDNGSFYLAQFLGSSDFQLTADVTAALPIIATPCAAPWAILQASWTFPPPSSGAPTPTQLRAMPNASKSYWVKYAQGDGPIVQDFFGAVNLPAYSTLAPPLEYPRNVVMHPDDCHALQPGDLLQTKRGALDNQTLIGMGDPPSSSTLCASLTDDSDCFNAGGQRGVAVRIAIVSDPAVDPGCSSTIYDSADDYPGTGVICRLVEDVATFVVLQGLRFHDPGQSPPAERGRVVAVYAGTQTFGPVRGFAQRPILVQ